MSTSGTGRPPRIIAGEAGGRRLAVPRTGVRPTSDRVKESVFAALGPRLAGARILDLWAGTGALALEALSRGAALAVLVERDREALATIRTNLESTGLDGRAAVVRGDVTTVVGGPPAEGGPFDLVLADPPYEVSDAAVAEVLRRLAAGGWLAPDALVMMERPVGAGPPPGWVSTWERCYGDTLVWFLQTE